MKSVDVPLLPTFQESHPESYAKLYDENGCMRLEPVQEDPGETRVMCGVPTPPEVPLPPRPELTAGANLRGFIGPYYTDAVTGTGVQLVGAALNVSTRGTWRAMGLVRNDQDTVVSDVVVEATLTLVDGTTLRVEATLPMSLRPGEPGPFEVNLNVEVSEVATVAWTTRFTTDGTPQSRDLEFSMVALWEYNLRTEPIAAMPDYEDPLKAPFPYLAVVNVRNISPVDLTRIWVQPVWYDTELRVVRVGPIVEVENRSGSPAFSAGWGGGDANFVVDDPVIGPSLGEPAVWGWA